MAITTMVEAACSSLEITHIEDILGNAKNYVSFTACNPAAWGANRRDQAQRADTLLAFIFAEMKTSGITQLGENSRRNP
jgi:hypothetical protein